MGMAIVKHRLRGLTRLARGARLLAFLAVSFLAADLRGQQAQPQSQQTQPPPPGQQQPQEEHTKPVLQVAQTKIAVEVKAVSVLATVRDKKGKIVANLTKDDFELQEDGKPQTINYFVKESDLPLRMGLLVDTSLSQRRVLDQERSASYSFLDHLLRQDKDLAFVIHFDRDVELLQEFTPERPKLQAALQSLQTPQFEGDRGGGSNGGNGNGGGGGSNGGGRGSRSHGGGTLLYDAIYLAADELMSKQQGRKALIILSDGVDHGSQESLTTAIETAQRADTLVYSILFKDDEEGGRPGGGGFGMGQHGGGGRRGGGRYPQEDRPDG